MQVLMKQNSRMHWNLMKVLIIVAHALIEKLKQLNGYIEYMYNACESQCCQDLLF